MLNPPYPAPNPTCSNTSIKLDPYTSTTENMLPSSAYNEMSLRVNYI